MVNSSVTIYTLPCLSDNYAYVIHNSVSGTAAVVDVPEAGPLVDKISELNVPVTDIFLTHHHWDHIDGLPDLQAALTGTKTSEAALKDAQRLGYAEADPTFDIEGVDAAHKITIMSAIAFGIPVQFDRAYVEGITQLGAADIKYAEQLGYRIKLLAIIKDNDGEVELSVEPTLVPKEHMIASVSDSFNAVFVKGGSLTLFVSLLKPRRAFDCAIKPRPWRQTKTPWPAPGAAARATDSR